MGLRVVIASTCDLNIYPAQYHLALALSRTGAEVTILSKVEPTLTVPGYESVQRPAWIPIEQFSGIIARLPVLRADHQGVLRALARVRPDWVVAQHGHTMSGLLYKAMMTRQAPVKVAAYFADYIERAWWLPWLRTAAGRLDAYIDVCDMRLAWREAEWVALRCPRFVVRNAPPRQRSHVLTAHTGVPRIVFTGRDYGRSMRSDLLIRFLRRLCENGTQVSWLLPGTLEQRQRIGEMVGHGNFSVSDAIGKEELFARLAEYDFGLLWTPTTARQNAETHSSYVSAAPNKLGEYMATGLGVLHTGNPGLSFVPDDCAVSLDPWDPERSADGLATLLANRPRVESMRRRALRFHHDVLNAEVQTRPLVDFMRNGDDCATFPPIRSTVRS